jgi:hypothetical protein
MNSPTPLTSAHQAHLRRKVSAVIWTLRIVACIYTAWVFWLIVLPLRDRPAFLERLGNYWQRDIHGVTDWQLWSALGLNLALWSLLLAAVFCVWQASRHLLQNMGIGPATSLWLQRGAWFGLSSSILGLLFSPLMSYFYTLHLEPALHLWRWEFHPNFLMDVLTCGLLLMVAHLMAWMSEIAEENKAFV